MAECHVGRRRTEQSHLGVCSGGCSMATVLPLLLVPGTCLECRAAPPPLSLWPAALNQFHTRHTGAQLHTHAHTLPLFLPSRSRPTETTHLLAVTPGARLKRTILTLKLTTFETARRSRVEARRRSSQPMAEPVCDGRRMQKPQALGESDEAGLFCSPPPGGKKKKKRISETHWFSAAGR